MTWTIGRHDLMQAGVALAMLLLVATPVAEDVLFVRAAMAEAVEAEFWDRIKDSRDPLLLEMYLKAFPDGEHTRTVRERLDSLGRDRPAPAPSTQGGETKSVEKAYRRGEGGWIGVQIRTKAVNGFGSDLGGFAFGAEIEKVTGHGPSARAGLAVGDVIVAINGKATGKHSELAAAVRTMVPGTKVTATVIRGGKTVDLPLTIGGIVTDNLDAADAGDGQAQWLLGLVFRDGLGVDKNQAEALKWFKRAAEGGMATAQTYMGYFYVNGEGVEKDDHKGVEWYRKAEAQNEPAALNNLGSMYEEGRGGLAKSRDQAIAYFRRSAALGFQLAIDNLAKLKVDPYDLAEIQRVLVELGHDPGPVDGKMGSKTDQAIRAFQHAIGAPVDGKASLGLAQELRRARDRLAAGTSPAIVRPENEASPSEGGDFGRLKDLESLD